MSQIKSSFNIVKTNPLPVDKTAARVGFFEGEHFDPTFPDGYFFRTFACPPKCPPRPEHAKDYTGKRHGRMTAFAWYRPSRSGGATIWLARCDCGRYEFRRPGRFDSRPSPEDDPDRCNFCRRHDVQLRGGNSRSKMPERLMKFIARMKALGLTDDEIVKIRLADGRVDTHGKTLDEIRKAIRQIESTGVDSSC